jgi:hypothetical protein
LKYLVIKPRFTLFVKRMSLFFSELVNYAVSNVLDDLVTSTLNKYYFVKYVYIPRCSNDVGLSYFNYSPAGITVHIFLTLEYNFSDVTSCRRRRGSPYGTVSRPWPSRPGYRSLISGGGVDSLLPSAAPKVHPTLCPVGTVGRFTRF